MKNILVATDLSARSDRAIDRAILLARQFDARLSIVHIVDDHLPVALAERQKDAAQATLEAQMAANAVAHGLELEIQVAFGKDWMALLEYAESRQPDLILLGTHRAAGMQDLFRGTTVERVIRNGNTPVLVARNRPAGDYRSIIVAVDFSVYSKRALELALTMAQSAELHLVHAYEVPFKGLLFGAKTQRTVENSHRQHFEAMVDQEMTAFLANVDAGQHQVKVSKILREGGPYEVIHQHIAAANADLLILGTHGRTGVAHAFLGSVAQRFLTDPPCDILAVKAW